MMQKKNTQFSIQFLWDKWKYHDTLAYSRHTSSMVLQAAVITVTILSLRLLSEEITIVNISILFALFIAWSASAFTTYVFIKSQEVDIRVRNSFNKKIVEELFQLGILDADKDKYQLESHDIENNKHPANLWHTPYPFDEGKNTRATKWNRRLMVIFLWFNVFVALVFFVLLVCDICRG